MLERAGAPESRYGPEFLQDVRGAIVSEENNARLVRAKVELGEADAAIVYRTDAISSDRVRAIDLPDRLNFPARYAVTPLLDENGEVDAAAERFVRFLRSEEGRALLREYGFVTEVDRESR